MSSAPFVIGRKEIKLHLHLGSLLWCDAGNSGVFEYPSVQEFHYVEVGLYDTRIFAETYSLWNRNISLLQGMDYSIFTVDLVSCVGEELPRRFLPHNIFVALCIRQLIGGIGLSIAKLRKKLVIVLTSGFQDMQMYGRTCFTSIGT